MIKWFRRRKVRKFIEDAFYYTGIFWPYFSVAQADEIRLHLQTLLVEYENTFGADDFSESYKNRTDY